MSRFAKCFAAELNLSTPGSETLLAATPWRPLDAILRYWSSAKAIVDESPNPWSLECYGGSNESLDLAKAEAAAVAQRIATAIVQGPKGRPYAYGDRALREEVLQEIIIDEEVIGIVSRNAYGAEVLNANGALFADIDYGFPGLLTRIKRKFRGNPEQSEVDAKIIERVAAVAARQPGLGLRLYRTADGFRALVTSQSFVAHGPEAKELLEALGSDPLYIKLCIYQSSFRARLTPKFWRCGAPRPPARIPWKTQLAEDNYRSWEKAYARRSADYSTCAFIQTFGRAEIHPRVKAIVTFHDRVACRGPLPLA